MNRILVMLCLLTGLAGAEQPTTLKPPTGIPQDAKAFNGSWFKVVFDQLDWSQAKRKCEAMGGRLAVIPDKETWKFIDSLTAKTVWIGASDANSEGKWQWVDGSPMTFTAWADGEPNGGKAENYLVRSSWYGWADTKGKWDAYPSHPVLGYICQWQPKAAKPASAIPAIEVAKWDPEAGMLTMKTMDRLKAVRVLATTVITLNGIKSPPGVICAGQKITSFTLAKADSEALGSIALEGIAAADSVSPALSVKVEPHVRISMRVDSADVIRVQGDSLWIEHIAGNLPKEIKVNGVEWKPTWDGKNRSTAFNQWPKPIPALTGKKVTVTKLAGRARSVTVIQQPEALTNHTLAVQINDGGPGAGLVELGLSW